jgi:hypothetical protein
MHFLTRVTLTALASCTLLGITSQEGSGWLDLGDLAALYRKVVAQRQREEDLADQGARLHARIRLKEQLAHDLTQGRLTLRQAAARFWELSADEPEVRGAIDRLSESGTQEERLCRFLILWTEGSLAEWPETARATGRRLRAELEEMLRCGVPLVAR